MKPLRVVLADDHQLVRAGIRMLLESIPDVRVVGEAGNGHDALRIVHETSPDIALVDLGMPQINGFHLIEHIVKELPHVKVIVLSMHRREEYVMHALKIGASGYIIKDAASSELETALRAVARGESYLSPAISKTVIASSVGRSGEELTPRQREVLRLIAEGQTTKEIAYTLGVSVKTVEAHRAQLMERLGIYDVPGLVRYAMRTGLVRPEPYQGESSGYHS